MKEGDVRIERLRGYNSRGEKKIKMEDGWMIASEGSQVGEWNAGVACCHPFREINSGPGLERVNSRGQQPVIANLVMEFVIYNSAAATITRTLAPPAYMPFRLDAAPM